MSFVKLKGFAAIVLLALTFTVQSPPPAQAGWGWLCWWCGPPSAISLINARPILSRQPENVRNYLASLITKYRNFGAPEEDVELFIDNLEKEYKLKEGNLHQGNFLRHFSGLFISSAYANPGICLTPYIGQVGCATAAQIAKKAAVKTGQFAVKNARALGALVAAMAISTGLKDAENDINELQDKYDDRVDSAPDKQPRSCNDQRHNKFGREVHKYCDQKRICKVFDDLKDMQSKIKLTEACIKARDETMEKCYNGGDKTHIEQILTQIRSFRNCLKFIKQLS